MLVSERLPRELGRDYALRILRENIVKMELLPGSQISESKLSAELGLSRTPIREALVELSKSKIVELYPQKKSVVTLIDSGLVEESVFMRHLLECAVVELDCQMATTKDIQRLQENVRLQNFYLDGYYPDDLQALDNTFHGILFDIACKSQVYALIQMISIHFDRVRNLALSTVKGQKIVHDHEDIINTIIQRDAKAAREVMQRHFNLYKIETDAIREQYPQFFK